MSPTAAPSSLASLVPPGGLPYVRWGCLAIVLVAELMALTLRFDTETLSAESGWWTTLLERSHVVPRLAIVIVAGTLIFGGTRLQEVIGRLSGSLRRSRIWWVYLLAHLVLFAGFAWLTAFVMEGDARISARADLWVAAWAVGGLLVVGSWCAAAIPPPLWLPILRRTAFVLAIGLALGVTAWLAGGWLCDLWQPFHHATFWVVRQLLHLTGTELVCQPAQSIIGTAGFSVQIAPECSGYEGMGLIAVFMSGYLWLFRSRLRYPAALGLLPLGMAVMWLLNAVRIAVLVMLGELGFARARAGRFPFAGRLACLQPGGAGPSYRERPTPVPSSGPADGFPYAGRQLHRRLPRSALCNPGDNDGHPRHFHGV